MKLLLATTLLFCVIGAILSQECPCANEIGKACRQPWEGPDFDNDRNWEYVGLVDFMTEKELADLPNKEPPSQPRELPPYDIELERAVAISPEGKKYIWRGPLPSREEAEPEMPHVGGTVPTMPPTATLPQEGAVCFPFSEQPDGRTRVTGNGLVLFKSYSFEVVSAPYSNIGGTVSPFAAGGVEMVAGVLKIHHAVSFRVLDPTIRAIVVTGLSAIDDLVVNMQMTTTGGISSALHVGSFPANFAASSGFEVRVLDSFAKSYAFISHNGPIASLLFGHVQIATSLCGYDSIPQQWYDFPLAGTTTTTTSTTRPGRSVYGTDTRARQTPTTGYPLRVFGAIHSPTGDVHYCSGSKIGPRHFLTAGHCMFNKDTKKWIPNARIWFGQNGDGSGLPPPASQAPFGITRHSWYYTTVGWLNNQDWRYDYGMIVLQDRPETVSLGWLGYSSYSYHSDVGKSVHLDGHPGSGATCAASPRADKLCAGFMYGDYGGVRDRSSYHLYYTIDTNKGNSGSAVYAYNGGNRVVVGVHAYGDNGDGLNKAVRIRNEVFDNLKSWKNQWPSQFD